jgi:hypothetical protein
MLKTVVRVSQGFFEPHLLDRVSIKLQEGQHTLEPALKSLSGLIHYYVCVDSTSNSMVNVSIWESLEAALQMNTLPEMLAQRDTFVELGVTFQPIHNYSGLWSIER